MHDTYTMLLHCISVIQSDLGPLRIKTIKVTTKFNNYLNIMYGKNKILDKYEGNKVTYIAGIPVVVDDTIEDEHYAVEFEE